MEGIRSQLEQSRESLLDLSLRNTLLNHRTLKSKGLEIVDELSEPVFDRLVRQERSFTFLPAPDALVSDTERRVQNDALVAWLEESSQTVSDDGDSRRGGDPADRHLDTRLQTAYPPARLERLLLNTYYTARSTLEEQGVNTLYLALGMLRWYESASSDEVRSAPLLLVPVKLDRSSARSIFRIEHTGEDLGDNLSLEHKLRLEFGITLPKLPIVDDLVLSDYFAAVADAIRDKPRWSVDADAIHLGFFWFTKLLMYEDLDPARWPDETLEDHPVLGWILGDGTERPTAPEAPTDLDSIPASDLFHIRDADSSQTEAILQARHGSSLVIQGPPGTGKSQTIANLIAASVAANRTVLFVAEKMAALDVVRRRLEDDGLGAVCMELHSHRTNKRDLLAELKRTMDLGRPRFEKGSEWSDLMAYRERLNVYAEAVNRPIGAAGVTPFQAYGRVLAAAERLTGHEEAGGDAVPMLPEREDWLAWTAADFQERLRVTGDVERHVAAMGPPAAHPFWSSRRTVGLLGRDRDHLLRACEGLGRCTTGVESAFAQLAAILHLAPPRSVPEARRLLTAAERAASMPSVEGMVTDDPGWLEDDERIAALLDKGTRHRALHDDFDDRLVPEAWDRDVLSLRAALVQFGDRWWRFLNSEFRRAIQELRMLSQVPLPKALDDRMELVDTIREEQALDRELADESGAAGKLFGVRWRGERSDWPALRHAFEWLRSAHRAVRAREVPAGFLAVAEKPPNREVLRAATEEAIQALGGLEATLAEVEELLELRRDVGWLRSDGVLAPSFTDLHGRVAHWRDRPDSLQEIVTYNHLDARLRELGLEDLADLASRWSGAGGHLVDFLEYDWFHALVARAHRDRPELGRFDGRSHGESVERFRELDRRMIAANRSRVALAHYENLPPRDAPGEVGVLRHEMQKRRRHLPIRRMVEEAGNAIQKIKPILMMSPLSVATYLPPGTIEFDLVIFDEASQVRPVDAFGALLRARQAIVVGDLKQLPPTPFFEKLAGDVDSDDEEQVVTDLESVLGLFESKGIRRRMLEWHYRSRHDSLIALSNREFYEDRLVVFPSPEHGRESLGVVFHHHPETAYEPGPKRTNPKEAAVVADAVMAHAREWPDRSLGVATFSQPQAKAILDELEIRRRSHPDTEAFFNAQGAEPFFVKNLENVQGDERDVIFISVGYGRQEDGKLYLRFGPLNQEGGERRLNVLVTRARYRCEVFANFRADELDLSGTQSKGVAALARYLRFAEHGGAAALAGDPAETQPSADGERELLLERIAGAVNDLGYEVCSGIGGGGYTLDLAVVDPERPAHYLLGIECDGPSYRSARWARDRDRLREQVLTGLGWILHRIWSTDWFHDADRERQRLAKVLERAKTLRASSEARRAHERRILETLRAQREAELAVLRHDASEDDRSIGADPYQLAQMGHVASHLRGRELHDASPAHVGRWVGDVVQVESPVHEDDVARRLVEASGASRVGARLREAVETGIDLVIRRGEAERRGPFLWRPGGDPAVPRDRSDAPNDLRKIERIAPEEIEAAVQRVVDAASSIESDEAIVQAARLLGFARTSQPMRQAFDEASDRLHARGAIRRDGTVLRPSAG